MVVVFLVAYSDDVTYTRSGVAGETVDDRVNCGHVDNYWPAVGLGCPSDQAVELYK